MKSTIRWPGASDGDGARGAGAPKPRGGMTKRDLSERVAERTSHISKRDTLIVVNTIFDSMSEALQRGERIEIRGFGTFQVKVRKAHEGRNPKTGEAVHIPAMRTASFRVGQELKDRVGLKPATPSQT